MTDSIHAPQTTVLLTPAKTERLWLACLCSRIIIDSYWVKRKELARVLCYIKLHLKNGSQEYEEVMTTFLVEEE
ncbi:hypothetical protein Mapa_010591 [Marchantia paleacea]|nr:hypothetical protein Mapa_010591 [Marchantia paleacea]